MLKSIYFVPFYKYFMVYFVKYEIILIHYSGA